jgi:hypothetical protein
VSGGREREEGGAALTQLPLTRTEKDDAGELAVIPAPSGTLPANWQLFSSLSPSLLLLINRPISKPSSRLASTSSGPPLGGNGQQYGYGTHAGMVVPQLGGETGEVDTKGRRKPRVLLMGPRRCVLFLPYSAKAVLKTVRGLHSPSSSSCAVVLARTAFANPSSLLQRWQVEHSQGRLRRNGSERHPFH